MSKGKDLANLMTKDHRLMFAELAEVMGYSQIEAVRIVVWEENIGIREYSDSSLKDAGTKLAKAQDVLDYALELRNRERSVRKKTEQHGIRYMVPMVRSEIVGWLKKHYDPNAKGPRFAQQQKMLDLVVKALPEEREAGGNMLADMVASLASRVIAQSTHAHPSDDDDEVELTFQ